MVLVMMVVMMNDSVDTDDAKMMSILEKIWLEKTLVH